MTAIVTDKDTSSAELDRLAAIATDVIRLARAKGASEADVAASIDLGLSVGVRLGEVETVEHTRDRGVAVTVYFGRRKGSANTADLDPKSIEQTVEHACAIARYTEEDPANGLYSGLGLSLARQILGSVDSQLWYEDREGGGARFVMEVPIHVASRGDQTVADSELARSS